MFSDPISVTIDSVAKSMARVTPGGITREPKETRHSRFRTADRLYEVTISQDMLQNGYQRSTVTLTKSYADPDPIDGIYLGVTNSFGLVFEVNPALYNSVADVAALRTALLAFVDATFTARLMSGEQ